MQRAADGMITQGALAYEADRMGLGVSDKELADYLHQGQFGQMFFPGGNFIGQQQYEDFVQSQFGMSVAQFEKELKTRSPSRSCCRAVSAAATVSDKEVEEEVKKQDTKVKFDYAVLTLDDVKKQIKVDRRRTQGVLRPEQAAVRELDSREAQGALHPDRHCQAGRQRFQ